MVKRNNTKNSSTKVCDKFECYKCICMKLKGDTCDENELKDCWDKMSEEDREKFFKDHEKEVCEYEKEMSEVCAKKVCDKEMMEEKVCDKEMMEEKVCDTDKMTTDMMKDKVCDTDMMKDKVCDTGMMKDKVCDTDMMKDKVCDTDMMKDKVCDTGMMKDEGKRSMEESCKGEKVDECQEKMRKIETTEGTMPEDKMKGNIETASSA